MGMERWEQEMSGAQHSHRAISDLPPLAFVSDGPADSGDRKLCLTQLRLIPSCFWRMKVMVSAEARSL